MELIATAGSPTANSYVTLAAATELLDGRLHTEPWAAGAMPADDNTRALIWATRLLDEQVRWSGTPLTRTQALAWPMTGQLDQWGRPVDQATIPQVVQLATALYALALRRDTSEDVGMQEQMYLASVKDRDTELVFRAHGMPVSPAQRLPTEIRELLRPYGTMTGSMTVPLLRT